MRKFDVVFKHKKKKKNVAYKDLSGQEAIRLMKSLEKKGFKTYAITYSFRVQDILTLKEMEEAVI